MLGARLRSSVRITRANSSQIDSTRRPWELLPSLCREFEPSCKGWEGHCVLHANEQTAARPLERSLGPQYQVINFGVSGYFSTIDELVLYDDFAKFFKPEVVLLFFVNYNDLEDLLAPAKQALIDRDLNLVYPRVRDFGEVTAHIE